MEGRQGCRNDKRRDLAAIPGSMPRSTEKRSRDAWADRSARASSSDPTYGQAPATAAVKTASQCDAEYAANKAAIKASGRA